MTLQPAWLTLLSEGHREFKNFATIFLAAEAVPPAVGGAECIRRVHEFPVKTGTTCSLTWSAVKGFRI